MKERKVKWNYFCDHEGPETIDTSRTHQRSFHALKSPASTVLRNRAPRALDSSPSNPADATTTRVTISTRIVALTAMASMIRRSGVQLFPQKRRRLSSQAAYDRTLERTLEPSGRSVRSRDLARETYVGSTELARARRARRRSCPGKEEA